ncbi:MAG: DUF2161 family putative PD-(D/E)XK-type phosphodiesterase [Paenibacillus dendritiformis]|uniref:DUF2161 family putative PD-(D/E)XK-type phosphodiesterase n=1 Tax=uncultured Paenibacillus sp. TaxID=227322 RepID=UPI0025D1682F|nr:DUF2161 family putative PD-(D/E)XK-type phosphodiesterase [uncultured Paenibacillus sp.]MDU5145292.1 DUF2161 family putative PD-(D/E)XK-type phosphodiesterase [Paenibacillus dendritiformis]
MDAFDHREAKPAKSAARKESELYAPLKAFFEARGYIVRGEVRHCDLVAMRPEGSEGQEEPPIIVEMKPSFNLTLVLQALERQKLSPQVYVAVEKKKGGKGHSVSSLRLLCGKLGIGFLLVTFYKRKAPFVEIICSPAGSEASYMATRPVKTRAARLVREFSARSGDYNVGGTTKQPLVTAYREKALRAAHCLADGPLRAAAVRDGSGVGDAAAILQRNYYGWFERVSRGVYALTGEGREALERYAHIVRELRKPGAGTAEVTGLPMAGDT